MFVEKWVFVHLIGSFTATIIGYGLLRVFEIIIYQINVLFFHPYKFHKAGNEYKIKSPTRIVILLLHNYVEVMF